MKKTEKEKSTMCGGGAGWFLMVQKYRVSHLEIIHFKDPDDQPKLTSKSWS